MTKHRWVITFVVLFAAQIAVAAPICPTTNNTNSDCGYILTIGPGGVVSGSAVANANPYDGDDDALVGVVNNSGALFTGTITLSGSGNGGGLFAFDGDGICTFIGTGGSDPMAAGSYCSSAATRGTDPGDYAGPLNTFSNINANGTTGTVDLSGLAAGGSTFFSLEGSPASINVTVANTPEPGSFLLLGSGLAAMAAMARRRLA